MSTQAALFIFKLSFMYAVTFLRLHKIAPIGSKPFPWNPRVLATWTKRQHLRTILGKSWGEKEEMPFFLLFLKMVSPV